MTPKQLGVDTDLKRHIYDTINRDFPGVEWCATGGEWTCSDPTRWLHVCFLEPPFKGVAHIALCADWCGGMTPVIASPEYWDAIWPDIKRFMVGMYATRQHFMSVEREGRDGKQ